MSTPLNATRRLSHNRWSLDALVAGLIVAALFIMSVSTLREGSGTVETVSQNTVAFRVYRAGEWSLEAPAQTQPEGWAAYRTGERAPEAAQP